MSELSLQEKADKLYTWIHNYLIENARSPSHREMAEGLHISTETIQKCLNLLKEQGRPINRIKGRGRQIWVPINQCPDEED